MGRAPGEIESLHGRQQGRSGQARGPAEMALSLTGPMTLEPDLMPEGGCISLLSLL